MERIELGSRARRSAKEMKGSAFGDRARQLTEWFQAWNTCEQTIALYSLLSKVSATQARFLSLVLEHSLKNGLDSQELTRLERHANSAGEPPQLVHAGECGGRAKGVPRCYLRFPPVSKLHRC